MVKTEKKRSQDKWGHFQPEPSCRIPNHCFRSAYLVMWWVTNPYALVSLGSHDLNGGWAQANDGKEGAHFLTATLLWGNVGTPDTATEPARPSAKPNPLVLFFIPNE